MVLLLDGKFNKWHITFESQEEAEKVKDMLERLINPGIVHLSNVNLGGVDIKEAYIFTCKDEKCDS